MTVDVVLARRGGRLRLSIVGNAVAGGGVVMDHGVATLGTAAQPVLYSGSIVSLNGGDVVAKVRDATGNSAVLTLRLNLNPARTTVTGSVSAR